MKNPLLTKAIETDLHQKLDRPLPPIQWAAYDKLVIPITMATRNPTEVVTIVLRTMMG